MLEVSKYYSPWLNAGITQQGITEIPGIKDNPNIVQYHKTTEDKGSKGTPDEVSWCSSFVNWCFHCVGMDGTRSKLARSWLSWGKELKIPCIGAVAVFKRGKSNWQGHVGFYLYQDDTKVYILGGNQGDRVSVISQAKKDLLGYRWPA